MNVVAIIWMNLGIFITSIESRIEAERLLNSFIDLTKSHVFFMQKEKEKLSDLTLTFTQVVCMHPEILVADQRKENNFCQTKEI